MKKLKLIDRIETERLFIEMPQLEDAFSIFNLVDDDIVRYMDWEKSKDIVGVEDHLKDCITKCVLGTSWEGVVKLKSGEIIGRFGLHTYDESIKSLHLGYWIAKSYWGKGYIPECIHAMKKLGFTEMGWDRIMITCHSKNVNSAKVAEKCGFSLDGILRHDFIKNGEKIDKAYYSILKEEYS